MENTSHSYVRIENAKFGTRGIVYTGFIFCLSFLVCAIIGATGPQVLQQQSNGASSLSIDAMGVASWRGVLQDMTALNQNFWLMVTVYRGDASKEELIDIYLRLNVTGSGPVYPDFPSHAQLADVDEVSRTLHCYKGNSQCSEFYLFGKPSVDYREYQVGIEFYSIADELQTPAGSDIITVQVTMHTVNSEYTKFELGWKCFFGLTTLLVLFLPHEGYLIRLCFLLPHRLWSFEQRWVLALIVALIFFNDPFFAAQIYTTRSESLAIFYIVLSCSFISLMLCFWLCVLDEMRCTEGGVAIADAGRRNAVVFYAPKLVLCSLIWALLIASFAYVVTQRRGDPTYEGLDDWVLRDGEVVLVLLLVIYILYLFSLLVLNMSKIRALSFPFKFLFLITLFVYVAVLTALFAGFFYPVSTSPVVFLCFYAIMNLYVWTLAFAYAPLGMDEGYSRSSTSFGEDYFDDHDGKELIFTDDVL